jgi:hypothetical protein
MARQPVVDKGGSGNMKFFVYYHHCYEIVNCEEFDTAEDAVACAARAKDCCPDAHVLVIKGRELLLDPVEVVKKYRLVDKEHPDKEIS